MAKAFHKVSKQQWFLSKPADVSETIWMNLHDTIITPKRKTRLSAGYDIHAPYGFTLAPGESIVIETGVKIELDPNLMLNIHSRSGMGFKYFARLANVTGIIDADYFNNEDNEGHIFIKIRNEGDKELIVDRGDAFAQGVIVQYHIIDNDDFDTGEERVGGIGSTS